MAESIMIQRQDGTTFNLDEVGLRVVSFDPPAPNYQHTFTNISELRATLTETQIQQTTIPLVFQIRAKDFYDYELMAMRVKDIFRSYEEFYVINMRIPMIRWKVVAEAFEIPRLNNFYFSQPITVSLDCGEGLAESVSLTSEDNFQAYDAKWGRGMNIPRDRDISYHFSNLGTFDVWNLGHIPLKADERPVLYEFRGNVGSQLTITNTTTNQTFQLNKSLSTGNLLQLYGMKPVVDNVGCYQNGNHAYLDLAVGKNTFNLSGASDWSLDVSTRFYY